MLRSILLAIAFITIGADLYSQRVLPVGEGITGAGSIEDMLEYNDQLILGGLFHGFNGHLRTSIQGWDGTNHYDYPGAFESLSHRVRALEIFNGDLIAAGNEPNFGHIARWDGNAWQNMGAGLSSQIRTVCIFNNELYAAGDGATVSRWNGSNWIQLGSTFNGSIEVLEAHDGELYVGGTFDHDANGTTELRHLAKWNGNIWVEVNNGLSGFVWDMLSTPSGLVIGGSFTSRGDGLQSFPRWTIYSEASFSEPSYSVRDQFSIQSVSAHPNGGFILGGTSIYALWVNGNEKHDIRFSSLNTVIQYDGDIYIGGSRCESYVPVIGIGRLVEGTDIAWLDAGSNSAAITPTTSLFYNVWDNRPGFEAPKGDSTFTIFSISPWIIGEFMNTLHGSIPLNSNNEMPTAGPSANTMDSVFFERYFQVWKLDRDMISDHVLHWNDQGYSTPYVISSWPGNGDVTNGEPAQLAPYADLNINGIYEPSSGEFPIIRGDQAIYTIQHSVPSAELGYPGMVTDLSLMNYAYSNPNEPDLYATVFSHFSIINRGMENYTDARFGIFADMDIGDPNDDLIGCDSTLNLFFGYNGDDLDDGTPYSSAYGTDLPAQGILFLNEPMIAHSCFRPPNINVEDLLQGTSSEEPFMDLGYPTHFQYPGGAWTDSLYTGPVNPTDRKSVGSIGPFTYNSGDTICVDVAYPYAMSASGNRLESVTDLKARAQALIAWYATQDLACGYYPDNITQVQGLDASSFAVYPNPTSGEVTLTGYPAKESLAINVHNVLGAVVQQQTWPAAKPQFTLSTDGWNDGIYILSIAGKDRATALRLVVSH